MEFFDSRCHDCPALCSHRSFTAVQSLPLSVNSYKLSFVFSEYCLISSKLSYLSKAQYVNPKWSPHGSCRHAVAFK